MGLGALTKVSLADARKRASDGPYNPQAAVIRRVESSRLLDRPRLGIYADWFAVAIAIVLPWSTTFTYVFIVLWLIALVASWNVAERCREHWMLIGGLPIVLWVLGVFGMLWATVPLADRFAGLNSFHKLLAIPFFAIQFRESRRGMWVLIAFLLSCVVMLIVSWGLILLPDLPWRGRQRIEGGEMMIGIPVKDHISQTTMFTLCILGLAEGAIFAWYKGHRRFALALVLLAIVFFANILYADTSRTALVALPILLVVFAFMRLGRKGAASLLIAIMVFPAVRWPTSPQLRQRVVPFVDEVRNYQPDAASTPAGERIEYWRKSMIIVGRAPVFGHGTGSIREQFHQVAAGRTGMAALVAANPHNQILATAIQLGLIGTVVLLAMWTAHLLFFFSPGLPAGIGFAVVMQNIISSEFNSSLFDSTNGWVYVLGVGVLSGMMLRASSPARADERCNQPVRRWPEVAPPT
jgi:O-antigen ligase